MAEVAEGEDMSAHTAVMCVRGWVLVMERIVSDMAREELVLLCVRIKELPLEAKLCAMVAPIPGGVSISATGVGGGDTSRGAGDDGELAAERKGGGGRHLELGMEESGEAVKCRFIMSLKSAFQC